MKIDLEPGRDWQPFFITALENANDGVILYDLAGDRTSFVIRYVNGTFEEQTGYRREEVIGAPPSLLFGPLTDIETARRLNAALLRGEPARGELLKYRKDGTPFWTEVNMRPLVERGALQGVVAIQRDISARKDHEEQFGRARKLLDAIMANTMNVVFAKDLDGRYLFVNRQFERVHGVLMRQILGRSDHDLFAHDLADGWRENDRRAVAATSPIVYEERYGAGESVLTYLTVKFPLLDDDGQPYAICGIATDITERAATLKQLQLLQLALDQARDAIVIFRLNDDDDSWRIAYVNEMMVRMTGYTRDELIGMTSDLLWGPQTDGAALELARENLKVGLDARVEMVAYRKDGTPFWTEFNASPLPHESGEKHTVVVYRDITEKKRHEEELSFEATHDALTGAYNRRFLERTLDRAIDEARERASEHGLIVMDLDGFKAVNDRHGHEAGDKVLSALVILISSRLRRGDILVRLGGDEFAVLLLGCSIQQTVQIANELIEAVAGYGYPWHGERLNVSASAGAIVVNAQTLTARNALRLADEACYAAKRAGKNRVASVESSSLSPGADS